MIIGCSHVRLSATAAKTVLAIAQPRHRADKLVCPDSAIEKNVSPNAGPANQRLRCRSSAIVQITLIAASSAPSIEHPCVQR